MTNLARGILSLLLIAVAALAAGAMRDAGWISRGALSDDGPWSIATGSPAETVQFELSAEETLEVGRLLDAMLGNDS